MSFDATRRQLLAATAGAAVLPSTGFAQATPRRGGTLRISVDQAVGKLNPLLVRVNPEYLVAELLYSGLTRLSADMTPEPDLAESWSASADLGTWTFLLRAGLKLAKLAASRGPNPMDKVVFVAAVAVELAWMPL